MRSFVAFGAFMAVALALLLWQGSDAIVHVRSPSRPARSTYTYPVVELEGSPVYYPHERQIQRRAAHPEGEMVGSFLEVLMPKPSPSKAAAVNAASASAVTITTTSTKVVVQTSVVTTTITTPCPSSATSTPSAVPT